HLHRLDDAYDRVRAYLVSDLRERRIAGLRRLIERPDRRADDLQHSLIGGRFTRRRGLSGRGGGGGRDRRSRHRRRPHPRGMHEGRLLGATLENPLLIASLKLDFSEVVLFHHADQLFDPLQIERLRVRLVFVRHWSVFPASVSIRGASTRSTKFAGCHLIDVLKPPKCETVSTGGVTPWHYSINADSKSFGTLAERTSQPSFVTRTSSSILTPPQFGR